MRVNPLDNTRLGPREKFGLAHSLAHRPGRLVVTAFLIVSVVGTSILSLPIATKDRSVSDLDIAFFTSVSAVTVTGLSVVDSSTHWSVFGQVVILGLVQIGGFGITTLAALLGIIVFRRVGLRSRLSTQVEQSESSLGNVSGLIRRVAIFYVAAQTIGFFCLWIAVAISTDSSASESSWFALFHGVSAFNNAGFSTRSDNLMGLNDKPLVLGVIGALVVVGSIGFPVVFDLWQRRFSWRRWSVHTRLTLATTGVLLVVGALAVGALEWSNPATLGQLSTFDRSVNAVFGSITPRTAGFNAFDYAQANESTLLVTQVLMLIGGGSGSSAGGIKVTTFALLAFVIWSEMRGDHDVNAFGRRIDERTQRQAVSIALLGVGLAVASTVLITAMTGRPVIDASFEAVSALNTVGLSSGITGVLSGAERVVVSVLMLIGRLGPLTIGTALVFRSRPALYRFPEGRPLLG